MDEEAARVLEAKIERQIEGFRNHLRLLTEPQHRVETNTGRATGHATEAIRLAHKLRRLKEHTVNKEAFQVKMEPNESPRGFVNQPTNVYVALDGKGIVGSGTKEDPYGNIKYAIDFIRANDPNGLRFWFINHKTSDDDPALDFQCYRKVPGDKEVAKHDI